MPDIGHFIWRRVDLLELLIRGFNDFVKVNDFKLFVVLFIFVLNKFVDFSKAFSQTRVKVVFYTIVCS